MSKKDEKAKGLKDNEFGQSEVDGVVSLTCECGAMFSRQQVPERLKKKTFFKWQFRYCDDCFKARVAQAFKRLPEIMRTLAGAN